MIFVCRELACAASRTTVLPYGSLHQFRPAAIYQIVKVVVVGDFCFAPNLSVRHLPIRKYDALRAGFFFVMKVPE